MHCQLQGQVLLLYALILNAKLGIQNLCHNTQIFRRYVKSKSVTRKKKIYLKIMPHFHKSQINR